MRNISIIGKFLILLGAVGFFVGAVTAFSSSQMMAIDVNYRGVINGENAASTALARANRSMQTARAAIGDLLMSHDDDLNRSALAEYQAAHDGFVKSMDSASIAIGSDPDIGALKLQGLQLLDVTCKSSIEQASASTSDAEIQSSQAKFLTECQPQFPLLSKRLIDKTQKLMESATALTHQVEANANSAVWKTVGIIASGLLAFLIAGLLGVRHWLVSPLKALSVTMARLANADYDAPVADTNRRDEIGEMAKAVEVFKVNGLKAITLEHEAGEQRERTEEERRRNADADKRRAAEMTQATEGLANGLKHLSRGDLRFTLVEPFAADFEALRADFNAAVDQLASTLGSVTSATSLIDAGSREISQSADDLSKRTEQQAASLEETAAALDEITANVSNSSQRTEEARKVASEARDGARRSSEVVTQAVGAMERIEASSRQISNIIGVIDEIAFQTNLLALNAGVEAARAGEAGKGFAVVAQEVRELAQRSAQAAKEIKDLIRSSEAEVGSGVALVRETGEALAVIEGFVANINSQMDAIATSAKEQSVGLLQVNTAVNEMDQVTQKNAAMVEEANAASASLAVESSRLRELVSAFKIRSAGGEPAQPTRLAQSNTAAFPAIRQVAAAGGNATAKWTEF